MTHNKQIILQDIIKAGFNNDELKDLCSRLDVKYEDLSGQNRSAKILEFVSFMERRKRLDNLLYEGKTVRPELAWPLEEKISTDKQEHIKKPEIYISYAWGGESETIVDNLEQQLHKRGIHIIRDKTDLTYKGQIKNFMSSIGQGKFIIVVISDKYLKSENCMFELVEIAQQGNFSQRIFPLVLSNANIYKAINRLKYIEYWETQIAELDTAMKKVSSANLQGIRDDIDNYTRIRAAIAKLTDTIKDMNTLTPEQHQDSNFTQLYQMLEMAIQQDQEA